MLEKHCQVMLMSEAAAAAHGTKPITIDDEEAEFTNTKTGTEGAGYFLSRTYFEEAERKSNGEHLQ